jgi:hypothetical protein
MYETSSFLRRKRPVLRQWIAIITRSGCYFFFFIYQSMCKVGRKILVVVKVGMILLVLLRNILRMNHSI